MSSDKKPLDVIVLIIVLTALNVFCLNFILPLPGIGILGFFLLIFIVLNPIYFLIKQKKATVQSFCGFSIILSVYFLVGSFYLLYAKSIDSFPREGFILPIISSVSLLILSIITLVYINIPRVKKLLRD